MQEEINLVSDAVEDISEPPMYRVYLHNDHYTEAQFVVALLIDTFGKPAELAEKLMEEAHKKGVALCGVYTHEVAETKVAAAHRVSKGNGFPLRFSIEEE